MRKVAILPLRKGSKGIPGKNKKKMVGRPLFTWVLTEAIFSDLDEIYVFTDDVEIIDFVNKEYYWTKKVKTELRNEVNANDIASTESAMIEFAEKIEYDFDILCLLQATTPQTLSKDINNALRMIVNESYDSVVTVVKSHRFIWCKDGTPSNYDVYSRPRRQDFEGLLIENGAVYATKKESFLASKNRVSGKIGLVEMQEESLLEIDSILDWNLIENVLIERQKRTKQIQKIEYLVLDVDGVFTDGCVFYDSKGEISKKFDMRDGMGLEILRQNQVEVVVITSERSELVVQRMKKLNIKNTFMEVKDKYSFLKHFIQIKNSSFGAVAYVGDDVNDLANICSVAWSFAPKDAKNIVKNNADFVLNNKAASGAIREVCEFIINFNKRYE